MSTYIKYEMVWNKQKMLHLLNTNMKASFSDNSLRILMIRNIKQGGSMV